MVKYNPCLFSHPVMSNSLGPFGIQSYSVHGILQARILEWVAISSSRESSWPRGWTHVSCDSCIAGKFFTHWAIQEELLYGMSYFGEGNGNPLQYSCLENTMDRGTLQATVHGVARVGHDWVTFTTTTMAYFVLP